jgi:hypothetical protein
VDHMDYDDAEIAGQERQERDGNPTLAQWARAEAVKAIMSSDIASRLAMQDIAERAHAFADFIVSGSMPKPPPGMSW